MKYAMFRFDTVEVETIAHRATSLRVRLLTNQPHTCMHASIQPTRSRRSSGNTVEVNSAIHAVIREDRKTERHSD